MGTLLQFYSSLLTAGYDLGGGKLQAEALAKVGGKR